VVPAALAIAERDNCAGRELLVALAAGFEVTVRIGNGLDYPAFRTRGWHGPGVIGPFGAAASVARLRGLGAETMARAFGLAGSQAAGTFAAWGTPTVKFHQCRGALSGLLAALLAEQDFAATREFLTAKDGGLYASYSNGGKPELATEGLGLVWQLEQIALRLWPSASLLQGLATALFTLVGNHRIAPENVRKVRVALSQTAFDMHGKSALYKGKFDALISGHYAAAAILHDRQLTLAQFEPARYDDPNLRLTAAERIEITPHADLVGVETIVEIDLRDGSTLRERCDHPRGSPELPVSWDDVERKFRAYALARLPSGRIDAVVDRVVRLEQLASVRELMDLLRAPA
jgi:2-methylcitrate dehydratase PrpD